jgi:hypothetical protein
MKNENRAVTVKVTQRIIDQVTEAHRQPMWPNLPA